MKKIYLFLIVLLCNTGAFAQIVITSQPVSTEVCNGQSLAFYLTATGENLQYQWFHNGEFIPAANSDTYVIPGVSLADSGDYTCTIFNNTEPSVTSIAATLIVSESAIIVDINPNVNACYGDPVTLGVIATEPN
ncbi:immunoglobulin domain-containing protein [Flavobacterium sp. 3HN19-14]|uniref:immunoglobulin domain-containing protein n=1 Tax=Flavobacterium sp. 3HN19-14 TaxID=3448133 RepID=UPI003EE3B0BB